jgi:hypothetical protein
MQVKQFLPLCYVNKRIRETFRESDEKKTRSERVKISTFYSGKK